MNATWYCLLPLVLAAAALVAVGLGSQWVNWQKVLDDKE